MSKKKKDKKSKKSKKSIIGYSPMGDTLTWDVAMVQAVTALDHAAALSISDKSPQGMREVAIGWLAVASSLEGASQHPHGEEEMDLDSSESNDRYPIGFRGASPVEPEHEHDEYDDEGE